MANTIGELSVGETISFKVGGVEYEWLVVHQGSPSTAYSNADGTWLLMKDIYENRAYDGDAAGYYDLSDTNTYLNSIFLGLIDADIQSVIKEVSIPIRDNDSITGATKLLAVKVFLLSNTEVGTPVTSSSVKTEGACLNYFTNADNTRRIAYYKGTADYWWLRSGYSANQVVINKTGAGTRYDQTLENGIRPAMVLPSSYEIGSSFCGNQNFGGAWEEMDSVWECYNGVWTELVEGYENINGVWQETN